MSVSGTLRIGGDEIDLSKASEVVAALRKIKIKVAAGNMRETVRFDGEEVTFSRANLSALDQLIREYGAAAAAETGSGRTRFAKRVRWY